MLSNLNAQGIMALPDDSPSSRFSQLTISDPSKTFYLTELLPTNPEDTPRKLLEKRLKEYRYLLKALEQAMLALERGELSSFDPLVGENACQLRAVKNALIFSKFPIDHRKLLSEAQEMKKKIDLLVQNIHQLIEGDFSLATLLKFKNVDLKLSYNELFILESYLLTIIKVEKPPKPDSPFMKNEYTDRNKLKDIDSIGTRFVNNLVKKLRVSLSKKTCKFVQELSSILPLSNQSLGGVSDKSSIYHLRLQCLPCYWTTMVVLLEAFKSEIPIVFIGQQIAKDLNNKIIKKGHIVFKASPEGYQKTEVDSLDPDTPALFILASSYQKFHEFPKGKQWKDDLVKYGPIDLILAFAATHRQYPDASNDYLVEQIHDKQYQYYKRQGQEWGCSVENPSLFFQSHVHCDMIRNIPEYLLEKED